MPLVTDSFTVYRNGHRSRCQRITNESGANAALTVSAAPGVPFKFLFGTVKYSAAPTSTVVATLNSGKGTAFDCAFFNAAGNQQSIFVPPGGAVGQAANPGLSHPDMVLANDDAIDILAPAGGAGITSAIAVYIELLEA